MPYGNPVVSGSVLVRTAIQSIDYVTGVSGWAIMRDGTAEFNNITVRGTFEAGGGAVRLNAGGLHIEGLGKQFDININAGFLARNQPDNGVTFQVEPDSLTMTPQNPSPLGLASGSAFIRPGFNNSGLANEQITLQIAGGSYPAKLAPQILLVSQAANDAGADDTSMIQLFSPVGPSGFHVVDRIINSATGMDIPSAQIILSPAITAAVVVGQKLAQVVNQAYPIAFPAGRQLMGVATIANGVAGAQHWTAKWINVSNSLFSIDLYNSTAAGGSTAMTLGVNLVIFVV